MKQSKSIFLSLLIYLGVSTSTFANSLTLHSDDISQGSFMSKAQEFQGFGCEGDNLSPQLSWTGAPTGTATFALFAYDPDAPTGSGWWHWQVVNIPANVSSLAAGTGKTDQSLLPEGAKHIRNDYGLNGFGGACPPVGHGVHRYQFTLYALPTKLELPEGASSALVGYMVKANSLASVTLESLYKRDK